MRTNWTSLSLAILAGCAAALALLSYQWAHAVSAGIGAFMAAVFAMPTAANLAVRLAAKMRSKTP